MSMSRAGRKELMMKAIIAHDRKRPTGSLVTAKVAHAAGLKSSTEVVKMLRELAKDDLVVEVYIEPSYGCGYRVRAWKLARWSNQPLPDRFITIGGVAVNWSTGEVVDGQQI